MKPLPVKTAQGGAASTLTEGEKNEPLLAEQCVTALKETGLWNPGAE